MKKSYITSSLIAVMALVGTGCSENYDIYPAEYGNVVMIKDAGEKALSVYSTDDKVPCTITVMKGGHTPGDATATLRTMTAEEFTTYQTETGKPYAMLPADCFSFSPDGQTTSSEVNFAANETYKEVEVYVNAHALGTFMETFDGSLYNPVIPMVLESQTANVNAESFETFILPSYSEPTLQISCEGNATPLVDFANGVVTATVKLPIENNWDITFDVAVDPDMVDRYNNIYGTEYTAIDPSAITGETSFTMPKGSSTVEIRMNIDKSKIIDKNTAVPLRITRTSVDGIEPDEATAWAIGTVPPLNLTVDMLSTNALEPTEGSLANLLDGDPGTFFHSAWSVGISGKHWLQISLPQAYSKIQIEYGNRISATTNTPAWFNFYTGTSESDLTLFKAYVWDEDGLKGGSGETNTLAPVEFQTPQKVFRIENSQSWNGNPFFVMTELRIWGF